MRTRWRLWLAWSALCPPFYHDSTDINDEEQRRIASRRLIAKIPTIAAMAYKYSIGQPFVYPRNDLDYASNFLHMCFFVPCEEMNISPCLARALWTASLFCMPTTSKTPRPQPCVWQVHRVLTRLLVLLPVLLACGA